MTPRHPQRGFTIVELMITVAVLAILLAFAVPSMTDFYDRKRLISQTEAISNLIQLARSEAIKHSADTDPKTITLTVKPAAPWFVGLSNTGTTACDNAGTPCTINQAGTEITRVVTATECTGCTMTIAEDTAAGTAVTTPVAMVFDLRGMVTSATTHDYFFTLHSPKGKQLSMFVSKIGRLSICSPAGTVANYPTCT
jgi:type IV fimbrial biogenesis protein FimT